MDYSSLQKFICKIRQNSNVKVEVIGKSVLGKNIYAVMINQNEDFPWAIITAAIHAREHLSCDIVIKQIGKFAKEYKKYSYNVAFVPLVNPDGAAFAVNGLQNLPNNIKHSLIKINGGEDLALYKANANGVDLNNNFNANWQTQFTNKTQPSSQGYYGAKPFSEPESRTIARFTKKLKPFITISYHLKGEEIYFDFFQTEPNYKRDQQIAQVFAKSTGYTIKTTQNCSSGGYKDWCVQALGIPALTIELGEDKFAHPYPKKQLKNIYNKNKGVFECLQTSLKIYNTEKNYEKHGDCNCPSAKGI